jgi:hypothetical protein
MEAETVRSVLEVLSFAVRGKASGTGPISGGDLAGAYTEETGQVAGEAVLAQLQRLPGLAQRDAESGTRSFVDVDMLAALQGGAFVRHVLTGFRTASVVPLSPLSPRARDMAAYLLEKNGATPATLVSVCSQLLTSAVHERGTPQHVADCLGVALSLVKDGDAEPVDMRGMVIDGAAIDGIALDEVALKNISFRNCTVRELKLSDGLGRSGVSFSGCIISRVVGATSRSGVPEGLISADSEIDEYDNVSTNSAVLRLDIPPQFKALITILRKLYKQTGAGRKMAALTRGITSPEVVAYIDPVVALLRKHEFVSVFNSVVHPVRRHSARVEAILASPMLADDPLLTDIKALS